MNDSELVGMVSGAIASVVFTILTFLTNISYFIVPVVLFLCSIFGIAVYELRNKVHTCDVCGEKLEPLPTKYKLHKHSNSKD